MVRQYYLCSSLWELAEVERQLKQQGLSAAQIHIHSRYPSLLRRFHLLPVSSLLLYDLLYYAWRGLLWGAGLAMSLLLLAFYLGVGDVGWVPIWMFAALLLGFCTWEGGLIGLQQPHHRIEQFDQAIDNGLHLLMLDIEPAQQRSVAQVIQRHPFVFPHSCETGFSRSLLRFQQRLMRWRAHLSRLFFRPKP